MSWPDMVYRPQDPNADDMGMVPFKPPADRVKSRGEDAGLPENWQDLAKNLKDTTAWQVEGNPLFEVAAGAVDVDFTELIERINTEIGPEDLYERPRAELPDGILGMGPHGFTVLDEEKFEKELGRNWGIVHEDIEGDLNSMMDWLVETVDEAEDYLGYSGNGPSASDWGYEEGSIWTILGLDKPPEGPQPLDEDMFKYKDSPDNYDVPEEYEAGNPWIQAGVWVGEHAGTNFKETRDFYDPHTDSMKPLALHTKWYTPTEGAAEGATENTTVEE